jgi:hypothetical protein
MFKSLPQDGPLIRGSTRKKSLSLSNFEFKFDLVFQNQEAQENLLTYLKLSLSEELLWFIQGVKEFKILTDKKKLHEKAQYLLDTFVKEQSPHEINIDQNIRESILTCIHEMNNKNEKIPWNTFDTAFLMVYRELGSEVFPRYICTKQFQEFVANKGEKFLKMIALDLNTIGDRSAYLFKPNDFLSTHVIDRDICFILRLNEDSDDWTALQLRGRNDYNAYVSKTDYSIGGLSGLKLGKVIGNIPKSAEQVLANDLDRGIKRFLPDGTDAVCKQEYVRAGDGNGHAYSSVLSRYQADVGHIGIRNIRRDFMFVSTVVYDTKRRSFVHVGKTSRAFNESNGKKNVKGDAIFGYTYVQVSNKMCCYVHTFYLDLKLHGKSGDFEEMVKSRADAYHSELLRSCSTEESSCLGPLNDTLEDFKKNYLAEPNAQKTWNIVSPAQDVLV